MRKLNSITYKICNIINVRFASSPARKSAKQTTATTLSCTADEPTQKKNEKKMLPVIIFSNDLSACYHYTFMVEHHLFLKIYNIWLPSDLFSLSLVHGRKQEKKDKENKNRKKNTFKILLKEPTQISASIICSNWILYKLASWLRWPSTIEIRLE